MQRLRGRMAPGLLAWRLGWAGRVPVFGHVGPPRRHVCHDRWPARTVLGLDRPAAHRQAVSGPRRQARGRTTRPYAVVRRTRRRGGAVRGAAGPAAWGRRRAGTACACCARYSTSWSPASSSSCSLIVNNVVAVEDGAALVSGQEHGDPLGDAGADQVTGGGAPAIVEEAGRHPGRLAGGAPRRAPAPDGDAVAVEDERAGGVAARPSPC